MAGVQGCRGGEVQEEQECREWSSGAPRRTGETLDTIDINSKIVEPIEKYDIKSLKYSKGNS